MTAESCSLASRSVTKGIVGFSSIVLLEYNTVDPSKGFSGLPRCKNLTRFSLFVSFCFAVRYCLKCFCFLCFTSSVSFTGSYTEVKPGFQPLY